MKGKIFLFLSFYLFSFVFPFKANASIVKIDKEGDVSWNVLSQQDDYSLDIPQHSYIEVKKAGDVEPDHEASVNLLKDSGGLSMVVLSGNETRQLDVSGVNGDLVEIEERGEMQRIVIGVSEDRFSLQQGRITALTDYPIGVDTKSANISLTTPSGDRFLSILPIQAVETLIKSNLLSNIKDNLVEIVEEERELQYKIEGEKRLEFFDLVNYVVPVKSTISASTGEVLSIEAPVWYKVVAILLT